MALSAFGETVEHFLKLIVCPSCHHEYEESGFSRVPAQCSPCQHVICRECISVQQRCPLCRVVLADFAYCDADSAIMRTRSSDRIAKEKFASQCTHLCSDRMTTVVKYVEKLKYLRNVSFRGLEDEERGQSFQCTGKYPTWRTAINVSKPEVDGRVFTYFENYYSIERNRLLKDQMEIVNTFENTINEMANHNAEQEKKMKDQLEIQTRLENELEKLKMENEAVKKEANEVKKNSFVCNECNFSAAEYRAHICVTCGYFYGLLSKENGKMSLKVDPTEIEKSNLLCIGCAIEGHHASHETINYQQLKLGTIAADRKLQFDSELVNERTSVLKLQTMVNVPKLLQAAREGCVQELSKLSDQTANSNLTWEEFNSKWNAAEVELSGALKATNDMLNVADTTEGILKVVKSKAVTELGVIRADCTGSVESALELKDVVDCAPKQIDEESVVNEEINRSCYSVSEASGSEWEALSQSTETGGDNLDVTILTAEFK